MREKILPNVEMTDILQWPSTPGPERWGAVARHLKLAPPIPGGPPLTAQVFEDARTALHVRKIPEFEDWAMAQFAAQGRNGNHVPFSIIKEIALRGTDESMIGIAIVRDMELSLDTEKDAVTLIVSQLHRDPSWTGINRILPEVKDLDCFLIQDEHATPEDPNRVIQVLAASPRFLDRELFPDLKEGTEFPNGPPMEIKRILEWHGARSCVWMTIEPK